MSDANLVAAMIILILTRICFSSIGIISASFIMVLKRGDPINMLFMSFLLVPLGLLAFKHAVKKAKGDGTLVQY